MNTLTAFFSEPLIEAFGWTLVHSLWQGSIIALALFLLRGIISRNAVNTRYWLSVASMMAIGLFSVVTFLWVYSNLEPVAETAALLDDSAVAPGVIAVSISQLPAQETAFLTTLQNTIGNNIEFIAVIWLIGVLLLTLRFLGNMLYVRKLRKDQTNVVPEQWVQVMEQLRERFHIRRTVQLLESGLVRSPMVIGYFKPVVLFPLGALAGMSPTQVEVILAHEMAHIARRDYLFNILQSVLEILFFYHPATWWISSRIRVDREHCCDDMAVSLHRDTVTYARALVELEELAQPSSGLALGFGGQRNSLFHRVARLLGQDERKRPYKEGLVAVMALVFSLLIWSFQPQELPEEADEPESEELLSEPEVFEGEAPEDRMDENYWVAADTSKRSKSVITIEVKDDKGENLELVINTDETGKVTSMIANGEEVPEEDYDQYTTYLEQMRESEAQLLKSQQALRESKKTLAELKLHLWEQELAVKEMELHLATLEAEKMRRQIAESPELADPAEPVDPEQMAQIQLQLAAKEMQLQKRAVQLQAYLERAEAEALENALIQEGVLLEEGGELEFTPAPENFFELNEAPDSPDAPENFFEMESAQVQRQNMELKLHLMRQEQLLARESARLRELEIEQELLEKLSRIDELEKSRDKSQARRARERSREAREYANEWRELENERRAASRERANELREQANERRAASRERADALREQSRAQAEELRAHNEKMRNQARGISKNSETIAATKQLKEELVSDGLIKEGARYELQINNEELRINGEKQSGKMHRKYKKLLTESHPRYAKLLEMLEDNGGWLRIDNE